MADPNPEPLVVAQVAEPSRPDVPYPVAEEQGLDLPLLAGLVVIVGLVIASNVWLRRRAEREAEQHRSDTASE